MKNLNHWLVLFNSTNEASGCTDYNAKKMNSIQWPFAKKIRFNCPRGPKKIPFLLVVPDFFQNCWWLWGVWRLIWSVFIHWVQFKENWPCLMYCFWKNLEKWLNGYNFWGAPRVLRNFFLLQNGPSKKSSGFKRCTQCIKTLHLSYQIVLANDFHISLLQGGTLLL